MSLVLGAGNQIGVPAEDILYKLFHEDEVVIVKMNPVNEFAGKYLEYVNPLCKSMSCKLECHNLLVLDDCSCLACCT